MGLLVMAGSRTAYALVTAAALLWVYGFTVPVYRAASRFFPLRGRPLIPVFLAAFFSGLFLLLLWFFNPLLALEMGFLVSLTPVCCIGSNLIDRLEDSGPADALVRALSEAAVLGLLILALALVREPLGCASLSLPGGTRGIVAFPGGAEASFFPVRIAASSAGGLLILGYGLALYRHFRGRSGGGEAE
jgi:hypothetical protein